MTNLTLQQFSAIVAEIYDSALDPSRWPATLERLCDAIGAASAFLGVYHPGEFRFVFEGTVGADPGYLDLFRDKYAAIGPFAVAAHFFKAGDVISVEDVLNYDEFLQTRFHREWAAPQGWSDNIVAILTQSVDRHGFVSFSLRERARHEKALVAALLPHLERAVRISDVLQFQAARAADLTNVVEGISTGVILVDADLNVKGINTAAERHLRELHGLTMEAGRLAVSSTPAGAEIKAAVAACAEGRPDALGNATILLDGQNGSLGLASHVLPLSRRRGAVRGDAIAAVFLTKASAPGHTHMQALVKRFGLTPSEMRVLLGLLDGRSPREIAHAHGIAVATIRTHLHRLYDKTGTSGQLELVQLITRLGAPP